MRTFLIGTLTVLTIVFAFSGIVAAQTSPLPPQELPTNVITTQQELLNKITILLNWLFTIFVIIAIVFIILAAFEFLTAAGSAEGISGARQKLIWAVIAIVIALLARGLPQVIANIIGVSIPQAK